MDTGIIYYKQLMDCNARNIVLAYPTGFGKSKCALDYINNKYKIPVGLNILIVIPKLVLIDNWIEQINCWQPEYLHCVTFTTYISLPKHADKHWNTIILDEVHHMSERCRNAWKLFDYDTMIGLSATVGRKVMDWVRSLNGTKVFNIKMRDAIESKVLPDPKVYLIPLALDNSINNQVLIRNKSAKQVVECDFKDRWQYLNNKAYQVHIKCTQLQYYNDITNTINYYKENMINEKIYLAKCNQRLKWLSRIKTDYVKSLIGHFKNYRTLTFCADITQTEQLGANAVNSKNKQSQKIVDAFNNKKIKHITSVAILDEGVNLSDCRIGIYAYLSGTQRLIKQRLGRILRHKNPIIIIPYYKNTREEEIVNKMILDYNPQLITTLQDFKEIKL